MTAAEYLCPHCEQILSTKRELRLWPYDYNDDEADTIEKGLDALQEQCDRECR